MLSSTDIATIIVQVMLIAIFITVFFFTYGSYLEQKVIKDQMDYIVNDSIGDIKVIAPEIIGMIKGPISRLEAPDMRDADEAALENNNRLKTKTYIILAVVSIILLAILSLIIWRYNVGIKNFAIINGIIIIGVGITYFIFSTFVIATYKSADPNTVKKAVLESANEYKTLQSRSNQEETTVISH
jgi:hypothetical protein